MRWIFFVLLAANALFLAWNLLAPKQAAVSPSAGGLQQPSAGASIVLVREAGEPQAESQPSPRAADNTRSSALAADVVDAGEALCVFTGPFDNAEQAGQLVERMVAMSLEAKVENVEIPAGAGYWVYIAPLDSRREALRRLSELQAQGIDSYIIPRGELMNGISLGMFSRESLAQARTAEMAERGIEAQIQVIERTFKEIWVSVPAKQAAALADSAWERLLEGHSDTERKQNFCLHVASQDNIH